METIDEWLNRVGKRGWTYKYPGWPKDLFSWEYDKIITFLKKRFAETDSHQKYYIIMPYIKEHVSPDALVRWEELCEAGMDNCSVPGKRSTKDIEIAGLAPLWMSNENISEKGGIEIW